MYRERLTWQTQYKEAASGMYGYTKATERDVLSAINRLTKAATSIVTTAYGKDNAVVEFLQAHANKGESKSARLLLHALKGTFPTITEPDNIPAMLLKSATKKGLYGFNAKTAELGINACSQLRLTAGEIATDLHLRKKEQHDLLTEFMKKHADTIGCDFARMLLTCYPDT